MHPCFSSVALALTLGLAVPLQATAQSLALPSIGDSSQRYLSPADERRLGSAMMHQLRDRGLIIDDVQLNEYLASIGQRIATYAEQHGNPYTFFLVRDGSVNAFAAPGGFIGVNSGLISATRSQDELAGVLAHEIAHISQRHIARSIAEAKNLTLPLAAALLASILVSQANSEIGQAAIAGTLATGSQLGINYTRANEQEADRIGTQILIRSGFDPDGLASFFKRLERLSGGTNIPEFLLTHPLPSSRIADTQNRYSTPPARRQPRDETAYYLAQARLRVLTNANTHTLIQQFETALNKGVYVDETAERYGYALALKRGGYYDRAEQQIGRLLKKYPDRLAFRIEEADIALAKGERAQAWRLFEELDRLYPNDYTVAIHYGQALAVQGDPRKAMQILEPHLQRHIGDAPLYALYAQAAQRAGDPVEAHLSMAEYYYLNGEMKQAIQQAEIGLNNPSATPYQEARLRARLRQLQEEEAKEKR